MAFVEPCATQHGIHLTVSHVSELVDANRVGVDVLFGLSIVFLNLSDVLFENGSSETSRKMSN